MLRNSILVALAFVFIIFFPLEVSNDNEVNTCSHEKHSQFDDGDGINIDMLNRQRLD
jgi:hypothetical protein